MAHHIMWSTPNFVYGGFLRDLVVGGLSHASMDLDVGVSTHKHPRLYDIVSSPLLQLSPAAYCAAFLLLLLLLSCDCCGLCRLCAGCGRGPR
jgi:hypothetical protein